MSISGKTMPFVALGAVALWPGTALAGQGDVAATKTYVQANHRLVGEAVARIHPVEAALRGVLEQVRRECPNAAASSPEDTDSEQLSNEVIGAMVIAVVHHALPFPHEYLNVTGRLSWSNPALNHTIHAYAANVKALEALGEPKLCADIESWVASGYHTLPASTVAFDARFMGNWVAPGELPAALEPYETAAERPILRATKRLEEQFTDLEAREVETWSEIMDTLVLQP